MANMIPTSVVSNMVSISGVTSGQRIVIQILNADNTVSQTLCDDAVPPSVTFSGDITYSGSLV